jgi:hypothetical protein
MRSIEPANRDPDGAKLTIGFDCQQENTVDSTGARVICPPANREQLKAMGLKNHG